MEEVRQRLGDRGSRVVSGAPKPLPALPGRDQRDSLERKSGDGLSASDLFQGRIEGAKHRPTMRILPSDKPRFSRSDPTPDEARRQRFLERVKAGDLSHLTKGAVARELKLEKQYHLFAEGDVARRMGLHERLLEARPGNLVRSRHQERESEEAPAGHGPPSPVHGGEGHGELDHHKHNHHHHHHHRHYHFPYCGPISAHFVDWCVRITYCGPGYYPAYCWYPRWSPWVVWSWHYHCHPLWDPRPVWCRPIIYVVAPAWLYWEVPVWRPLPVVACGTWVDVPPVVVPKQHDLQLLAVRFVDPGHPEENLGPRYRIWFRNNSDEPITRPFNVTLLASADDRLRADLPQAGARVTAVEAGDIQAVDVRLPAEVNRMARDAEGKPAPFATLHVIVDANREIEETTEANNGARLARIEILPVDPAAFEVEPKTAMAGGEVILAGEGFGPEPGQVLIHLGGIEIQGEIRGWYDLGVKLGLPDLPLAAPTEAELIVVRGDGAAANPLKITLLPGPAGPEIGDPAIGAR